MCGQVVKGDFDVLQFLKDEGYLVDDEVDEVVDEDENENDEYWEKLWDVSS
jgi:hypothetical protein